MNWLTKSFLAREFMGIDLMYFLSGFLVFTTVFDKVKNNKVTLLKSVLFWIISKVKRLFFRKHFQFAKSLTLTYYLCSFRNLAHLHRLPVGHDGRNGVFHRQSYA